MWWLPVALGTLVVLRIVADVLPKPADTTAQQRRAWYRKRLARRRGDPDDERFFAEDR